MNPASQKRSVIGAAGTVAFFTFISRIAGFVRDMIIAHYFGTKAAADAFFVAFRIPNLLRRLTAEGALSAAFIPVFAKTLMQDRARAIRFANNILVSMTMFLVVLVIAGIFAAPVIVKFIAIGFTDDPEKFELTVKLTRLLFPYILFVSLAAIVMGILNTMHHFAAPAASPIMLNLSIILSTVFLYDRFELPSYALAVGVIIGGVLQLLLQVPFAVREGFAFAWVFDPRSELLRKVVKLTIPAAFGFAVAEINMFVDTILASLLKEGSVSFLYYSNRLVQFPMGIFAIAMSTALLPSLSFEAGKNDTAALVAKLSRSFRTMMLLILPSTVGLIVLREPIVRLVFERGEFDAYSTANTAYALAFYSIGLLAFASVKIFVTAFYALGDTKTPVKIASYAMALNIALNLLLMGPLQHGGLALATSISSAVNFAALLFFLRKKLGGVDGGNILKAFIKLTACSLLMGAVIYLAWDVFFKTGYTVLGLAAAIIVSALFYFALTLVAGSEEARRLKDA
ncbi:MAG: murein biosynthesis integral membrane protein MurJ, partial [Nitrospinota bacterium]